MKRRQIEDIHAVMKANNMVVFDRPFSVTLGGIRTKDNVSNRFNDWLFASFFTKDNGLVSAVVEGTTDAGLFYRENPLHIDGTAIIKDGVQHMSAYRYENPSLNEGQHGHKGQEAFSQIGDMRYHRDPDRDKYLEQTGPVITDNFRTNGHDMGTLGKNVNKWSAGCWGSTEENMEILYAIARLQIMGGMGDVFSFAMLNEDMF